MKYLNFQRKCRWLVLIGLVIICIFSYFLLLNSIPDKIRIIAGREETFDLKLPVTGEVEESGMEVFTNQNPQINTENIHIDMNQVFTLESVEEGKFSIVCKLFGIFSLKEVDVEVVNDEMVLPCGIPVGIYVGMDGILVIGTGPITGMDGTSYEPAYHLVQSGDYVKTVNDEVVSTKEELIEKINKYGEEEIILGLMRNNEYIQIQIPAVQTGEEEYKLGIWVRDDMAGVGTMTYYTSSMEYGALGHPVSDADTSTTVQLDEGLLYETEIVGITKGEKGSPGELAGVIDYRESCCMGSVEGNFESGIYGTLDEVPEELKEEEFVEVALKQEVEAGAAKIISYVSGEREEYDIEITVVDLNSKTINKGIQFQVTDEELLELTGGIVQGMSGSPIMQNGRIVGAVTHVFVNDPTKGYGIFIENMLEH